MNNVGPEIANVMGGPCLIVPGNKNTSYIKKMKHTKKLAAAGLMVFATQAAFAIPSLRITDVDNGIVATFTDEDIPNGVWVNTNTDFASGVTGQVASDFFTSLVVGDWTVDFTVGSTKDFLGTATEPRMEIDNFDATSTGSGTLRIEFSETGFGPAPGNSGKMTFEATLLDGATATFDAYSDNGNALVTQTEHFGQIGLTAPGGGGAVSGNLTGTNALGNPFSITQVVELNHNSGGTSEFDASIKVVPDGGTTVSLLGLTLLGLGFGRRALRK